MSERSREKMSAGEKSIETNKLLIKFELTPKQIEKLVNGIDVSKQFLDEELNQILADIRMFQNRIEKVESNSEDYNDAERMMRFDHKRQAEFRKDRIVEISKLLKKIKNIMLFGATPP